MKVFKIFKSEETKLKEENVILIKILKLESLKRAFHKICFRE